jgi:transposase
MKPLYARALTEEERQRLREGLKSSDGFTVRRAQMILLSADEGLKVDAIGARLGCQGQAVREAIHAFDRGGLSCLRAKQRGRQDDQRAFDETARARLRMLVHQSPRTQGYDTSLWTLDLLAEASFQQGLTSRPVSGETVRATLAAMGISWKRAKHWLTSPDPHYEAKKTPGLVEAAGGAA